MAGDRTIAPSRGRLQRAWRAGRRPRGRMLTVGVGAWFVAGAAASVDPTQIGLGDRWGQALASAGELDWDALISWGIEAGSRAIVVAVGFLAAALLVAAVTGGLGRVDRREAQRLVGARRPRRSWIVVLQLGSAVAIAWACVGVVAGAARSVAASPGGLVELWSSWAVRLPAVAGSILVGAGLIELLLDHRAYRRALFMSTEEARNARQERGSRSR